MSKESAVLDLPPAPPAYVEAWTNHSTLQSKEVIAILRGDAHREPPEPPNDHEHSDEGPRPPIEINISETLTLSESLNIVLTRGA